MARPQISEAMARQLATAHWGLVGPLACSQLAGYDDRNNRLQAPSGECWVLKAHNAGDSEPSAQFAEAQNALLLALAGAGVPVPAPLPLVAPPPPHDGAAGGIQQGADGYTLRVVAPDGRLHAVRCLTWLPGTLLVDAPQSLELYRQLGALLGRTSRWLADAGWDWRPTAVLHREFDWNICCLPATYARVRGRLLGMPGLDVPLLDAVVAHFEAATATAAARGELRTALIHSDANERNVLVDAAAAAAAAAAEQAAGGAGAAAAATGAAALAPAGAAPGGGIITGLIDWGDASWQWLAAEPANAAAYMMLLAPEGAAPLPAAAALVRGFEAEQPLRAGERRALRALCMGRLAQSLSLGAAAALDQPDNKEYLLGTQRAGWRLLRTLWSTTDDAFLAALGPAAAAADAVAV